MKIINSYKKINNIWHGYYMQENIFNNTLYITRIIYRATMRYNLNLC